MKKESVMKILYSILFYATLIILWNLVYVIGVNLLGIWKTYAFPSPKGVAESLWKLSVSGELFHGVANSLFRVFYGFMISLFVGVIFGFLIVNYKFLNSCLKPLLLGVQSLPSLCWVPFSILWLGLNESAVIFVIVMGAAFSVSLSIENGVKSIPPIYIKAARTMGAGKRELYIYVIFPAALPAIISGLKQTWSFAWRALMSAEVMGAVSIGIGFTLYTGREMADINQVMSCMIVIMIVGILVEKMVFTKLERTVLTKRGLGL